MTDGLSPVDITPYRAGNTGIEAVTTFDSQRPGPHVMVAAVTHGNELCGAHVLDFLFHHDIRPMRGKLTLGFMNVDAYSGFDPALPRASRYLEEDLNRVWDAGVLDGMRNSTELRRARALRPLIDTVDFLLDIHSMQHATAPLALAGPLAKGRHFAGEVGYPHYILCDAGHAAGRRLRDYGAFSDPASSSNALLVECGAHADPASVDVAREVTLRFLVASGALDPNAVAMWLHADPPPQRTIEITQAVTVATAEFRFADTFVGMEMMPRAGTVIAHDGRRAVRTPYDDCVLVMPNRRLRIGDTAVRLGRFV
jgi:predicted deacylase